MQPTSNVARERMAEALSDFITKLPDGVSKDVLEALGESIETKDGILPPRLFIEVVEQLAMAISIADVNGVILYCNPRFEQLSGYPFIELQGQTHSILSYKKTPDKVYRSLWHNVTNGKKWNGTLLNKRKDGSPYLADLTVAPVLNADHEISYYIGIHRDVTQHVELETRLKNQKALLESVIDNAPLVLCVLNDEGKVVVENHGYKVLTADLAGEEPAKFLLSAVEEAVEQDFQTMRKERRNFDTIEIRVDFGGARTPAWYSCSGTWIENVKVECDHYFDKDVSEGLVIICNDISKRRFHFEQAKTNAVKALMAEKQMNQGISEVLSGAIYQLQGPLNLVSCAAAMLERGASDSLMLKGMLQEVQKNGQEALEKLKACMPEVANEAETSHNVNELVREVLDISTEKFLSEGIMVNWHPTPVMPSITGQGNALRSMIKHLLDNAILAINEPGATGREITITTNIADEDTSQITISDLGCGIDAKKVHKVFEPFFTNWVKAKHTSGMGLAIVQQVLIEHHGTIEITPSMGGGSKVTICLPQSDE